MGITCRIVVSMVDKAYDEWVAAIFSHIRKRTPGCTGQISI